ncbi:MAG: family 20 glycosylhydrolase [Alistipes sp.]|nr:family 20 glycosylhydrolase [Alistipes sp.]
MNFTKNRAVLLLLTLLSFAVQAAPAKINDKPFVIPELKEWKGAQGTLTLTDASRIVIPAGNDELQNVAEQLAADLGLMFGLSPEITSGKGRDGDIVISVRADKSLGDEGYTIKTGKRVEISSPAAAGAYWATRTLLQMADNGRTQTLHGEAQLPCGSVRDWPDYAIRGFMIDTGRKFFPMEYLEAYSKIMAYYKMNFLQVHLNDCGFKKFFDNDWSKTYAAFRLECDTYPGLAAEDGHYTKAEFRDFQKESAKRYVEVLPEIDVPAHTLAFTHYMPELGSTEYGADHFDLFNPATYEFTDALLAEYLSGDDPVFAGPKVSIGTDEYSNRDKEVVEKFRAFTDRYIRYVEEFGKQACVWGSLSHARGETPVKIDNVIMHSWSKDYAEPREMADLGYKLISIPDRYVYIVPAAGYYYDYLNTQWLYENWTPANINGVIFPEKDPSVLGGMFAVWNDHVGNGISNRDVHHRAFPAMQTLAVKMWTGAGAGVPFAEFDRERYGVAEAPGVELSGRSRRLGAPDGEWHEVYAAAELLPDSEPFPGVDAAGYDYRVSFDIECAAEKRGTELLRSFDGVFYLSDPVSGMLGFARDGYLNRFGYRLHEGRKMRITVEGDNRSTRLYIDGRMVEEMKQEKKWWGEKASTNYVPTLVFPLGRSGEFRSRITDFKVEQR